jgi:hypothetical protein
VGLDLVLALAVLTYFASDLLPPCCVGFSSDELFRRKLNYREKRLIASIDCLFHFSRAFSCFFSPVHGAFNNLLLVGFFVLKILIIFTCEIET